jgi:peptidoglycan hydrolase-like protein with peptidoglycan-binding domain/DNA invertase Pin-like site-specific DNA recombinase
MQLINAAHLSRLGPPALAFALVLIGLLVMPVPTHAARQPEAMASAGWHGRAIQNPRPRLRVVDVQWPKGWSAGPVGFRSGYTRPGGSERVRDVQRRLVKLGYRPGPVDGLFGPRTRAATQWFQFKHGLPTNGRVNRSTLAVLTARSDHKPLPTKPRGSTDTTPATDTTAPALAPPPASAPVQVPADGNSDGIALALLLLVLALGLGIITGLLGPDLLRAMRAPKPPAPRTETPPRAPGPPSSPALSSATALTPAPAPRRPRPAPRPAPRVLGYAVVDLNGEEAESASAALALRCARQGWSLLEVIHDGKQPGHRLAQRPGLGYALRQIRSGVATGLVVARMRDFTIRITDLATLLRRLDEANAFLGAADHELDTSTRAGQATARAVIELGRWERRLIGERTRQDLANGRFTPGKRPSRGELNREIAAMLERGISRRAIADALNLADIATPAGQRRWQTTDVRAVTEEALST